jgi:hypothetical protein
MKTTQHTPGPWIRKGDWIHGTPESGASQGIAQILGNCGCSKTTEANARLIAAAPELLAALELIYANAGESPEWIRMTILKATRSASCTCDAECSGPVPNYCAEHDGDYSAFLAFNNCD